jgi:hypothetical protein
MRLSLLSPFLIVAYLAMTSPKLSKAITAVEPPVFTCHADAASECAYTIHDAHGSINLVLASGASHGYNTTLIGARYCVAWGRPRVPTPSWPQCYSVPPAPGHSHDVVKAGNHNG